MLLAFVDTPQRHGRLTIFPVVSADEPHLSYVLMADALRRGVLTVEANGPEETSGLLVRNRGTEPVLILDCEAVEGMRMGETTDQSVLLGPASVTRVPTSSGAVEKWSGGETEERFGHCLESFPLLDNQVGILAFLGQHLLGLDVLGCPDLYADLHRRLLTSYLLTGEVSSGAAELETPAEQSEIQALARALEEAERVAAPCPGNGEYTTIHGQVTGGELRHNGQLVHLSVCPSGAAA